MDFIFSVKSEASLCLALPPEKLSPILFSMSFIVLCFICVYDPWTEEPDELQPVGSQRVGHD